MTDRPAIFEGAHEYQNIAFNFALDHPFSCLFMDMGMGKTIVTLTLLDHLIYEEMQVRKVLIVAPLKVARLTWTDELAKWPHLKRLRAVRILGTEKQRVAALKTDADIYIINRDNLLWLLSQVQRNFDCRNKTTWPFDTVVLDELSTFKNKQSQRFKAMKAVRPQCERIIGLTGTPVPNGYEDLWAQIYTVDRGKALGKGITAFRTEHFDPDKRNGPIVYSWKLKKGHDVIVTKQLENLCLTLRAKDWLDTPTFKRNIVYVDLPFNIAKQYAEFERDQIMTLKESGEEVTALAASALRNKLLQFANGAVYTDSTERTWAKIHDEKLDALEDIFDEAQGRPVFVAWAYKHDRDRIMERFGRRGAREFRKGADGDTDQRDWNAGKIPMLICHPASVAYGLNLQEGGSIIVWFGMTDSLELYLQFNARLERQGQKCAGFIHHIICKGTEDDTMIPRIEGKEARQDEFLMRLRDKIKNFRK